MADVEKLVVQGAEFADLPPYLIRYIDIRHSVVRSPVGVFLEADLVADCLTRRNDFGRRSLAETVSSIRCAGTSVAKLQDQLSVLDTIPFPAQVVRAIAERLESLGVAEQAAIADTLRQLSSQATVPVSRVLVDRAIGRILPLLLVLARYPCADDGCAATTLAELLTARNYARGVTDAADLLSSGAPVFAFEFADQRAPWFRELPPARFPQGAYHAAELPYLFDVDWAGPLDPQQRALATETVGYWSRFARTGDPNGGDAPHWQPHTGPDSFQVLAPAPVGSTRRPVSPTGTTWGSGRSGPGDRWRPSNASPRTGARRLPHGQVRPPPTGRL